MSSAWFAAMAHDANVDWELAREALVEARRRLVPDDPNLGMSTRLVHEAEALVGSE